MKKVISGLFIAAAVAFTSGCTGNFIPPSAPDMNKCFTMTAVISVDSDKSYTASMERSGTGCWKITFQEPSALSGMIVQYENGKIAAELDGICTEPEAESWARGPVYEVISAIESAAFADGSETVTVLDGVKQMAGSDYTLIFDAETETLTGIECGNISVVVGDYVVTADAFQQQVILHD